MVKVEPMPRDAVKRRERTARLATIVQEVLGYGWMQ